MKTKTPTKAKAAAKASPHSGSMPSKLAKNGTETCKVCGRKELFKGMGPGTKGLLKFHYCPGGLPCSGSVLGRLTAEDTADGKHESDSKCPKCFKRVSYK